MRVVFIGSCNHTEVCIIEAPLDSAVVDVMALLDGNDWIMPARWKNVEHGKRIIKPNPYTNSKGRILWRFERKHKPMRFFPPLDIKEEPCLQKS